VAGPAELLVQESVVTDRDPGVTTSAVLHGVDTTTTEGVRRLSLHPCWEPPAEIPLQRLEGGHGGGDARMLQAILGPPAPDPFRRRATELDGALSLVTGLAANRSLASGIPVRTEEVLSA
jgi:hypothetical protein